MTATRELELVTFRVGGQWFGVPVLDVREILVAQRVARVPLAPPDVDGFLNLRGHIVTAISLHARLSIPRPPAGATMNVVVADRDELFALVVDEVGDVVSLPASACQVVSGDVSGSWEHVCRGVVSWEHGLLVVADVAALLDESQTVHQPRTAA